MTELLQQVIENISQLSDEEQNKLARQMLNELEVKKRKNEINNKTDIIFDKLSYWMTEANRHSKAITLDLSQY